MGDPPVIIRLKTFEMKIICIKFYNYYTVLLANGGRKITFGLHQFTVITVTYQAPTFIYSWSISNILEYKFFRFGYLGSSRAVKISFSEKATKFFAIFLMVLTFVALSEKLNFNEKKESISEHLLRVCFQLFEGKKIILDYL